MVLARRDKRGTDYPRKRAGPTCYPGLAVPGDRNSPARAGLTTPSAAASASTWDPRTGRGRRRVHTPSPELPGTTPARAGLTDSVACPLTHPADYPRMGGANVVRPLLPRAATGLPPHGRGGQSPGPHEVDTPSDYPRVGGCFPTSHFTARECSFSLNWHGLSPICPVVRAFRPPVECRQGVVGAPTAQAGRAPGERQQTAADHEQQPATDGGRAGRRGVDSREQVRRHGEYVGAEGRGWGECSDSDRHPGVSFRTGAVRFPNHRQRPNRAVSPVSRHPGHQSAAARVTR